MVGSSLSVGDVRTLSALTLKSVQGNRDMKYIAVEFMEGDSVSLRSFMGLKSLNGWQVEGESTCEYINPETSAKDIYTVKAQVVADFSFGRVWQPEHRTLLAECDAMESMWSKFQGRRVRFVARPIREFVARRPSPDGFSEKWATNMRRVMTAQLWEFV